MKRGMIAYLLFGLFFVSSLASNTYTAVLVFELKGRIEEFYQKDFVEVKSVSEQLIRDINRAYGDKLPLVELNIRLSGYSDVGIQYNNSFLRLFLPPNIINLSNNQKRAYIAHEFGHYVLGHVDRKNSSTYSFFGTGNLVRDIQADSFALKFSSIEDISSVVRKLVWDEDERKTRLNALGVN